MIFTIILFVGAHSGHNIAVGPSYYSKRECLQAVEVYVTEARKVAAYSDRVQAVCIPGGKM